MNFPILSVLIFLPLLGAFFVLITKGSLENINKNSKNVALFTSLASFFISLIIWFNFDASTSDFQFIEEKIWIKGLFNFKLGIDGISILFILLTTFITPICIISGITSIKFRIKEFLISILVMET